MNSYKHEIATANSEDMYSYKIKEISYGNNRKKLLFKFVVYGFFLSSAIVLAFTPLMMSKTEPPRRLKLDRYQTDLKYILIWKLQKDQPFAVGQKHFIEQKCRYINCYLTENRSLLHGDHRNFDAIVFNVKDIAKAKPSHFKIPRSPHQKFIFRALESSERYPVCDPVFESFFNWTWTYKLNSDIPQPSFNVYDEKHKRIGPKHVVNWTQVMKHNNNFLENLYTKSKAVAWIIPKCSIKGLRKDTVDLIAKELAGYNYTVDMYGACAPNKCPDHKIWKCYKMIQKQYFFHLIMEEYFSEDYVSEYVMKTLVHDTYPLIFGGANYERFLPPGSYIDLQSIEIKKLGAIVDFLIRNPIKYSYLFDWKNHYYFTERPKTRICDLCTALNIKEAVSEHRSYNNFRSWWNPDFRDYCKPWVVTRNESGL